MSANDLQKVFRMNRNFSRDDNDVDLYSPTDERRKIMKRTHQRSNSDPLNPGSFNNLRKKAFFSPSAANLQAKVESKEEQVAAEAKEETIDFILSSASDLSDVESQKTIFRTSSIGRVQLLAGIKNSSVRAIELEESDSDIEGTEVVVVQDDGRASPPIDPVMSILSLSTDSKQVSFGSKGLSPLTQFLNREDTPQEGSMLGTPMPSRDTDMEVCLSLFQRMSSSSDSTNMVMMSSEDIHLPERGIFLRDTFAFSRSFSGQRAGVAQIADQGDEQVSQDLLSLFNHSSSGTNWQVQEDYGVASMQAYHPSMNMSGHVGIAPNAGPIAQGYAPEVAVHHSPNYGPALLPPAYPAMHGAGPALDPHRQPLDQRESGAMPYPSPAPATSYAYPLTNALPPLYLNHNPRQPSEDDSCSPLNFRVTHSFGQMQLGRGGPLPPNQPTHITASAGGAIAGAPHPHPPPHSAMPHHTMHYPPIALDGQSHVGGGPLSASVRVPMNYDRTNDPALMSGFAPMVGVASVPFLSENRANAGETLMSSSSSTNSGNGSDSMRQKKQVDKSNRGNYHCGRCGMLKANHVCPFSDAPPTSSKETQTALMALRGTNPWEGFHNERFITVSRRPSL